MARCTLWFSLCTLVSSTNKTDSHGITEILLKVALNTITSPYPFSLLNGHSLLDRSWYVLFRQGDNSNSTRINFVFLKYTVGPSEKASPFAMKKWPYKRVASLEETNLPDKRGGLS